MQKRNPHIYMILSVMAYCLCIPLQDLAQVHMSMTNGIETSVSGDIRIQLSGDLVNNGHYSDLGGTISFNGILDQHMNNASGAMFNVEITKPFGTLICETEWLVNGDFTIFNGDADLNGHILNLTNGSLTEQPGQTVKGSSGYIYTSRNYGNVNGDTGFGLGLSQAGDIGITEVYRGHNSLTGNGNLSINRWFEIASPAVLDATTTVEFNYDDSELAGQVEADLKLFKSLDGGSSWQEIPGTLDMAINKLTAMDLGDVGILTLSSFNMAGVDCPFDLNGDLVVNTLDLLVLLTSFGCETGACPVDFNNDGNTNTSDLLLFLGNFGTDCLE